MARARVETPTVPMSRSAMACFDDLKSCNATPSSSTQRARIRFFDDQRYSRYIREQLENKEEDALWGRKIFRPTYVAIGPRFHREDDLKQGQEWKRMAAWDFWEYSDQPFSAMYAQVEKVAGAARSMYSPTATAGYSDQEFTTMMFVDGCFLLQVIVFWAGNLGNGGVLPVGSGTEYSFGSAGNQLAGTVLQEDTFMVENQIPWFVLEALMSIRPIQVMPYIDMFVASTFDAQSPARPPNHHGSADDYRPIHLFDLLRKRQIGGQASALTLDEWSTNVQLEGVNLTSATQLAEAGVDICPSRTSRFADIDFSWRWSMFARLSLPPLVLRHTTIAPFLNMLAFELLYPNIDDNRGNVAAYFGMLSALVCREEDVQQLRRKGILQTTLGDKEVISLLKKLEPHTNGNNAELTAYLVRAQINDFFKRRGYWIDLHRFVYKNLKFLIAIGSFLSVSLSILKAILALPEK